MSETTRLVTAEELEKYPDDDYRYELVDGRIVRMTPVGLSHGRIVVQFGAILFQHVKPRQLGVVFTELGVTLARNPDTVRAPDIAFIRQDRLPSEEPQGFWNGPPDLAVEVLSPDDTGSEMRDKVAEYLARGVAIVVVVDPSAKTIAVHRAGAAAGLLHRSEDVLDLDDVVPGFRCRVRDVLE
jgi:Uma2 family endonuclease